jgi:hypothetical protein
VKRLEELDRADEGYPDALAWELFWGGTGVPRQALIQVDRFGEVGHCYGDVVEWQADHG